MSYDKVVFYFIFLRTATHPNQLAAEASKTLIKRKLKRKHLTDLTEEMK